MDWKSLGKSIGKAAVGAGKMYADSLKDQANEVMKYYDLYQDKDDEWLMKMVKNSGARNAQRLACRKILSERGY